MTRDIIPFVVGALTVLVLAAIDPTLLGNILIVVLLAVLGGTIGTLIWLVVSVMHDTIRERTHR